MKVFVTRDAAEFAQRAGDFLRRRPIEHNVLATVSATQEPTIQERRRCLPGSKPAGAATSSVRRYARHPGDCWSPP